MQTLFIGSTAGNSGKTLITVGLGLALKECGYKVGYLKPLGKLPTVANGKVYLGTSSNQLVVYGLLKKDSLFMPVIRRGFALPAALNPAERPIANRRK